MTQLLEMIVPDASRGITIVVGGILLYAWRKKSKERENKRDMARILRNEINRALNIVPNRDRERIASGKNDRIPDSRIYSGLLQTGNIRFFSDEIQNELDEWYSSIDNFQFKGIDPDAGIKVIRDLENMEHKNKSYTQIWKPKRSV